jgi:hypothetical protein
MSEDVHRSIQEVAQAIERLNRAFEKRAEELRERGNTEELGQWIQAKAAMKDSGVIYLSWARHYAKVSSPDEEEKVREDEFFEPTSG